MENQQLFEAQRDFLRKNKNEIFGEFLHTKIGFDLHLPIKIAYYALFALHKNFTTIHEEIHSEKFIVEEFEDVLDALYVSEGDNFSLKESFKAEAKLNVITDYVRSIKNKKIYPSEIKRKEKSLNNCIKRAEHIIDNFFKQDDIQYKELFPVIDIYEVIVKEHGKQVDLHFGRHGFTLNDATAKTLRNYLNKERVQHEEKLTLIEQTKAKMNEFLTNVVVPPEFSSWLVDSVSAYKVMSSCHAEIEHSLGQQLKGVQQLAQFLTAIQTAGVTLPEGFRLKPDYETILYRLLHLSTAMNPAEILYQTKEYKAIEPFIQTVLSACRKNAFSVEAKVKNGLFFLKGTAEKTIQKGRRFEDISLQYTFENGKMYRITGEEIYTPDALIFEFAEHMRRADERYALAMDRAKDMLLSTLSKTEEQLFREKSVTIVEGEQNYYALVAVQCHTNVVKIPKKLASLDEIKALCIHPEDASIPLYDGFASIALSVKSGDEAYVLANSNEFRLGGIVKEKLKEAFAAFEPLRHLQLT